jgi:hypothetical protein
MDKEINREFLVFDKYGRLKKIGPTDMETICCSEEGMQTIEALTNNACLNIRNCR